MADYLKAEGARIRVLFAHNDSMALGGIDAIEDAGLQPGSEILVIAIEGSRSGLEAIVAVEHDLADVTVSAEVASALWFVCSESLANAVKHAGAGSIRVALRMLGTGDQVWSDLRAPSAMYSALYGLLPTNRPRGIGSMMQPIPNASQSWATRATLSTCCASASTRRICSAISASRVRTKRLRADSLLNRMRRRSSSPTTASNTGRSTNRSSGSAGSSPTAARSGVLLKLV